METIEYLQKLMHRSRRTYALGIALTLLLLAATVLAGWLLARTLIRQQIAQRDADLLYATTLMEQLDAQTQSNGASVASEPQVWFDAALLASRLKGVVGIRFFDPDGGFTDAFPATIQPWPLDAKALEVVRQFRPHSRFRPDTPLTDVFIYLPSFQTGRVDRIPTLEVTVPLHQRGSWVLAGAAQFIVEGNNISMEYARLDRHLAGLAGQTFVIAGALLGIMLWLTFRQVERLNRLLAQRSEGLQRANEELAMAARTSALGAVSAHLMHGLRNPLASLAQALRGRGDTGNGLEGGDWEEVVAASRRMQALVEETLEVLADTRGEPAYDLSLDELVAGVRSQTAALAASKNVHLTAEAGAQATLSSRVANLVRLILVNLVENAVQATPAGKAVHLRVVHEADRLVFRVDDQGAGFPTHLRPRLFLPCKSTREGGSGIGLTISKQLADHLGATLELSDLPGGGCRFSLGVPTARLAETPPSATD